MLSWIHELYLKQYFSQDCIIDFLKDTLSNYLCAYDLYGPVRNVFDACRYIMWKSGKGVGPWKSRVFWAL